MSKKRPRSSLSTYLSEKPDVLVIDFHGNEYNVHAKALSDASDFFKALFEGGNWKENLEGRIAIKFEDPCLLFPEIVAFIYNGYLNCIDVHSICPLLKLSDQLQIPKLTELLLENIKPLKKEALYLLFRQSLKHGVIPVMEQCVVDLSGSEVAKALFMHSLETGATDLSSFYWLIDAKNQFASDDLDVLNELSVISLDHMVWAQKKLGPTKEFKLSKIDSEVWGIQTVILHVDDMSEAEMEEKFEKGLRHQFGLQKIIFKRSVGKPVKARAFFKNISKLSRRIFSLHLDSKFSVYTGTFALGIEQIRHISCHVTEDRPIFTLPVTLSSFECMNVAPKSFLSALSKQTWLHTLSLICPPNGDDFWPLFSQICNQCKFLEKVNLDLMKMETTGALPPCSCPSLLSLDVHFSESQLTDTLLPWMTSSFPNVSQLVLEGGKDVDSSAILKFSNLAHWKFTSVDFLGDWCTRLISGLPKLQTCECSGCDGYDDEDSMQHVAFALDSWDFVCPQVTKIDVNGWFGDSDYQKIGQCFPNLKCFQGSILDSEDVFQSLKTLLELCKQLCTISVRLAGAGEDEDAIQTGLRREFPQLQFIEFPIM